MRVTDLTIDDLFMEDNNPDIFRVTSIQWSNEHKCGVLYAHNITRSIENVEFFYKNPYYATRLLKLKPVR